MDNTTKIGIAAVGIWIWYLLKDKIQVGYKYSQHCPLVQLYFGNTRRLKGKEQ